MWGYTPRQISAYCFLIDRRQDIESHRTLSLLRLGQADDDQVKKQMKQWEQENE